MRTAAAVLAVLVPCALLSAAPPLKVCMLSGSKEYASEPSLTAFAAFLTKTYGVKCTVCRGTDGGKDLPGLEALDDADVMLVFCRRMKLPPEQIARIRKHCDAGKAVVGIRTASHAFSPWLEFDRDVLGGNYRGHGGNETVKVTIEPAGKDHPILAGFKPYERKGKMYKNQDLPAGTTVLLTGTSDRHTQPLAWIHQYKGGRVFYTSMGYPHDFADPTWRQMLVQAVFWTAKRTPPGATAASEGTDRDDDALAAIVTYKAGDSRASLIAVADRAREARDPAARSRLAGRLAALLAGGATTDCKQFICRQLRLIGSADQVPAVAALLTDKDLSHMARYALEEMEAPEAGAALRDALGKAKGKLLAGVIGSIGRRRDRRAVHALIALLGDADEMVASAAAAALGRIGGPEAAEALEAALAAAPAKVRAVAADAYLLCADGFLAAGEKDRAAAIYRRMYAPGEAAPVRRAALHGRVAAEGDQVLPEVVKLLLGGDVELQAMAVQCARDVPGAAATRALGEALSAASPDVQVALLGVLAGRADASARDAVVAAAGHRDARVRAAALAALATLGDASTVPLLARAAGAGDSEEAGAAAGSLARLRGADVNAAIVRHLAGAPPAVAAALIRSLAARRAAEATGILLKAAGSSDASVRAAACQALGELADEAAFPSLLTLVTAAADDQARSDAESAAKAVARRLTRPERSYPSVARALSSADAPARCALLRVLACIGGRKALGPVRAALADEDPHVRDAALRALAEWPDDSAVQDLLQIAREDKDLTHHVLALRGYVRLAGANADRSPAGKLAMYKTAMDIARRKDEKVAVLAAMGDLPTLEALRMVVPYLGQTPLSPGFPEEAAAAAVSIARKLGDARSDPEVRAAMRKVLEVSRNETVTRAAQQLLGGRK